MGRTAAAIWALGHRYSDALVPDFGAVADARPRVELLPQPPDESLRLREPWAHWVLGQLVQRQ